MTVAPVLLSLALALAPVGAAAAQTDSGERRTRTAPAAAAKAPPPAAPAAPSAPPYEPQLIRLAQVLGGLHHLRAVCGAADAGVWRERMASLVQAEGASPERRDRLAGAFNDSYRAWARSYRACTPAAELAARRFLTEARTVATDVSDRYGP
ncbi:TIGR02301 family protein [Methylopila musalis]|uniref:TIGR02301 family protein n=1 Tax=Methylopila musalis TaxID=1134781 RepID=A0ABW3ZCI3_9HYPH